MMSQRHSLKSAKKSLVWLPALYSSSVIADNARHTSLATLYIHKLRYFHAFNIWTDKMFLVKATILKQVLRGQIDLSTRADQRMTWNSENTVCSGLVSEWVSDSGWVMEWVGTDLKHPKKFSFRYAMAADYKYRWCCKCDNNVWRALRKGEREDISFTRRINEAFDFQILFWL